MCMCASGGLVGWMYVSNVHWEYTVCVKPQKLQQDGTDMMQGHTHTVPVKRLDTLSHSDCESRIYSNSQCFRELELKLSYWGLRDWAGVVMYVIL